MILVYPKSPGGPTGNILWPDRKRRGVPEFEGWREISDKVNRALRSEALLQGGPEPRVGMCVAHENLVPVLEHLP